MPTSTTMPPPPPGLNLAESKTASNMVVVSVLFFLSVVFVGLRMYTRLCFQRKMRLEVDDWVINVGLVLNAANLTCVLVAGRYGLGKHMWALSLYEMRQIGVIHFAFLLIYAWTVSTIKLSIILFYRRIFGLTYLGRVCILATACYLLTHHIVVPLFASPVNYYWDRFLGVPGVLRINEAKFILAMAITNMTLDILILAIPIPSVLHLHLPLTQKLAVVVTFLLGSFVCFASLYRLMTIIWFADSVDMSWTKSDVFIWSLVEPSVGIISACLPSLRPLLTRGLERVGITTGSGKEGAVVGVVETVSRRRVRKREVDVLDETIVGTRLGDEEEDEEVEQGLWEKRDEEGLTKGYGMGPS